MMPEVGRPELGGISTRQALVSAIDRNYVVPYAAMLASLRDHNPATPIAAFVIHYDLQGDDLRFLAAVARRTGIDVQPIRVPAQPLLSFATRPRWHLNGRTLMSPISYAKAFIDRLLPPDLARVICIDADVIVNGDMSEIWEMTIASPVMAVSNIPLAHSHQFNSGFMLVDLAAWRRWRIADVAERFLARYADALHSHDQHVLNLIFRDRWSRIDLKWNYMEEHYRRSASGSPYTEAEIMAARQAPIVVHYVAGKDKPWKARCRHPRADLYRRYRAGLEDLMTGLDLVDLQAKVAMPS
jgi:lipopolysaccharide biosynthesis glycosyltransferase